MNQPVTPSHYISADQGYMYRMQNPFFLALDERIVKDQWESRDLHWHDYFEIEIVLDGTGTHQYNGTIYPMSAGCAYLLTPMDIHALIPDPGTDLHVVHIRFDEQAISDKVRNLLLQHNHLHTSKMDDGDYNRLLLMLNELIQCFEMTHPQSLRIQLMLSYICLHIIRDNPEDTQAIPSYNAANPVVHQTLQYIFYNFRKKITMQELGEKAHVSPNHLALLFKQSTGTTCMQMIADLRLQYAAKLLENPNLNIETVSAQSGFSATSYFISVFKNHYGVTPKEYQNQYKSSHHAGETQAEITASYDL